MLHSGTATVETWTDATELTPSLQISIVRIGKAEGRPETVEAVRDAVEFVEQVMQRPLPTDHVVLVLDDRAVDWPFAGANYSSAISFKPEYERPDVPQEWLHFQKGLVHEVAHYFWGFYGYSWINEGLANLYEYMYGAKMGMSQSQLRPRRGGCEAHDLKMLGEWDPARGSLQFYCNYYLGEILFRDLMDGMDTPDFAAKLVELYLLLSDAEQDGRRTPAIDAIHQVFSAQTDVINQHWAGAGNAPGEHSTADGIERPSHDLVQWDEHPARSQGSLIRFKGTLLGDAVLSAPTLALAQEGGYSNFTLHPADSYAFSGHIFPQLTGGWTWIADPSDVVAFSYSLDERTFTVEFPFQPSLGRDPSAYVVVVWGYQDSSRTPTMGAVDILGYARIRADQ